MPAAWGGDGAGSNTVLKSAGANFIGDVSSRQQVALPAGLAPLPCMPLCARIHHIVPCKSCCCRKSSASCRNGYP